MPLSIDAFNKLILVTSPTIEVDAQTLSDFIEDYMASPVGMANDGADTSFRGDIQKPEGKIEDPSNPGVFTQIIVILNPEWQIQFFGGSGYTRIFGGKFTGGVGSEVMKATGTAGDITVLESQVDGTVVEVGSGITQQDKDDIEDQIFARIIEAGYTFEEVQRILAAHAAGNIAENASGDYDIRDINDTKPRITGSDEPNGGRDITAVDAT